jgi:subtilisin family serine protease
MYTAGSGVHVYVLDTGIRTSHEEFMPLPNDNPNDKAAAAEQMHSRALHGFDAVYSTDNSDDCHGHGTHVAAVIGGEMQGIQQQPVAALSPFPLSSLLALPTPTCSLQHAAAVQTKLPRVCLQVAHMVLPRM